MSTVSMYIEPEVEEEAMSTIARLEISLWDIPLWYIVIVLFAGTEWYLRRRDNLV